MRLLLSLLLSLTAIVITIAVIEILVATTSLDFRPLLGTLDDVPWKNPVNRLDPELLHVRRPGLKLEGTIVGGDISQYRSGIEKQRYSYDVTYDQNGFRDPADRKNAEIVVVGDSFVEAPTISDRDLATSIIQSKLGRSVENLGQSWYGPQQMHIALSRYGLPLKPRDVVWVFYGGNDLFDYRRYQKILPTWSELAPTLNGFMERSLVRNLIRFSKKKLKGDPELPTAVVGDCEAGPSGRVKLAFFYPDTPLSAEDRETLQAVSKEISSAAQQSRSQGARFLLVYAPSKFQTYRELCKFNPPTVVNEWSGSGLAKEMSKIASSAAIDFLDLTPELSRAARERGAVYFSDDTHWNQLGHAVVGETIAEKLR